MSKKLDAVLAKIQKDYKIEVKSAEETCKVDVIPTDSPSINYVLSGGIPLGRLLSVHGSYSSGKSSLASYLAGQLQKKMPEGRRGILYFDLEYSFTPSFSHSFGLDTENNFIILQPTSGEDMFEIAKELIDTGEICMVIVDSISVLASKAQLEDPNKATFGGSAKTTSNGLKYLMPYCNKNKCSLFLIAQERDNVGCVSPETSINWKYL